METPRKDPDERLTTQQVADELKVHIDTVVRWIRAGKLDAAMLGSNRAGYRITRRDLDAFLAETFRKPGERE